MLDHIVSFYQNRSFVRKNYFFLLFALLLTCFLSLHLEARTIEKGSQKLARIHSELQLIHGNLQEEYPEQLMSAIFLSKNAKVLELGANVGRNSCVIGKILKNSKQLVAVESCEGYANLLRENRDANGLKFSIEVAAVSKTPLIQYGWNTVPSDVDVPGWTRVNTITFDELEKKYQIVFDTFVIDCEGAFYHILRDDPKILKNIKLIIIENDFDEFQKMVEVQNIFKQYGLQCVYNVSYPDRPCGDNFFQVWKKMD